MICIWPKLWSFLLFALATAITFNWLPLPMSKCGLLSKDDIFIGQKVDMKWSLPLWDNWSGCKEDFDGILIYEPMPSVMLMPASASWTVRLLERDYKQVQIIPVVIKMSMCSNARVRSAWQVNMDINMKWCSNEKVISCKVKLERVLLNFDQLKFWLIFFPCFHPGRWSSNIVLHQ